ncbi:hypothetical protein N9Q54_00865 [Octadecabacter sp.]|nr:hypothetical protein [Octadecabacter sp.]
MPTLNIACKIDQRSIDTYIKQQRPLGEFKDGAYNGQGTFTFADGRQYVGEYKDGSFVD